MEAGASHGVASGDGGQIVISIQQTVFSSGLSGSGGPGESSRDYGQSQNRKQY